MLRFEALAFFIRYKKLGMIGKPIGITIIPPF
jgi:hypothetical protein